MHLGLKPDPISYSDSRLKEPCCFTKVSDGPISKFATSSVSKRRDPDTHVKKPSKYPVREGPPSVFPQQVSFGERCSSSRASGFISLGFPRKQPSHQIRGKIQSSSTEPHGDGRSTYSGVRPGSSRGSLATLLHYPTAMLLSALYLPPWGG
jgi:hypothetical protein